MNLLAYVLSATIAAAATVPPLHAGEAATVGDAVITTAELERAAGLRLLRVRAEAYEARRAAIEKRVAAILVERRASEENLQPEAWLEREVAGRVTLPSAEEIAAAYETLSGPMRSEPKEQAMADLARSMREVRSLQARHEIEQRLRQEAHVEIRLEAPRLDRSDLGGTAVHGPDDAPVTMVVFEDFQCPRCATLSPVLAMLRELYPATLRILHRDFPLANHPQARAAAEAAACAGEQGKFWDVADALYTHRDTLTRATFEQLALDAHLDRDAFAACLDSGRQSRSWQEGLAAARALALDRTPTVFINGRPIFGAREVETYVSIIEEELRTR